MDFVLIGLAVALFVFGVFEAVVLFVAMIRGMQITLSGVIMRPIYAGIGVGGGFWLLSLANVI